MITLEGKLIEWREGLTLRTVMERTGLHRRLVYVAVDGRQVRRRDWDSYQLPDGARIEIFPMVLGG